MSAKDTGRHYHRECTGLALETVKKHSEKNDITLFAACFCPFVQRVWVALEELGVPYHVNEVDPYQKPADLLEVSPKGLVPGLRLEKFSPARSLHESTVILEYIEDVAGNARSLARLQADHISRTLVPAFYRYLQAQDASEQIERGREFIDALGRLSHLLERAEKESDDPRACGLWKDNGVLGWVDIMAGPWLYRASIVLKHYRGFSLPPSDKFNRWLDRLFEYPAFKATCSTDQLYLDSYERYAFNRPNTSMVADAINRGQALP
ncbi:thioredoxin-like protein [Rickenella mellea]|uniref:Thioredoxin-like protein n=1 Tax=Rickenella mellea TaxID=50990 RepID=A0A4Y7PQ99_9AGAM|nr:thioredoxin-like protein [Rickenella mellea]